MKTRAVAKLQLDGHTVDHNRNSVDCFVPAVSLRGSTKHGKLSGGEASAPVLVGHPSAGSKFRKDVLSRLERVC